MILCKTADISEIIPIYSLTSLGATMPQSWKGVVTSLCRERMVRSSSCMASCVCVGRVCVCVWVGRGRVCVCGGGGERACVCVGRRGRSAQSRGESITISLQSVYRVTRLSSELV